LSTKDISFTASTWAQGPYAFQSAAEAQASQPITSAKSYICFTSQETRINFPACSFCSRCASHGTWCQSKEFLVTETLPALGLQLSEWCSGFAKLKRPAPKKSQISNVIAASCVLLSHCCFPFSSPVQLLAETMRRAHITRQTYKCLWKQCVELTSHTRFTIAPT
jgi:hypothetical protein